MLMKRVVITATLVIGGIAFAGGALVLWMNRTANSNTNTPAIGENTNHNTNARVIVTREEKGDINIAKSVTYRDVTFEVVNAATIDAFHGQTAPAGKQFVVLFLKPLAQSDPTIFDWLSRETSIKSSTGTNPLKEAEIMGPQNSTDTGYLWFTVGSTEKDFMLVFSDGKAEQTLDLGF